MTPFLYAAELKKTFRCYGHFYRLQIDGCAPLPCRSQLEITSLPREAVGAATNSGKELFDRGQIQPELSQPDVVVIMMNPGSSRPLEDGHTDRLLRMPLAPQIRKPLVLTQPDNTQYQIMRIMVSQGWTHARVLNISDIRDPKSPSFIARTKQLEALPNGETHSLFSKTRTLERKEMLRRKPGAPLILGWGQDASLIPLATQCFDCIRNERIVTVPAERDPILTAHPSPMLQAKKLAWLTAIRTALDPAALNQ